MPTPTSTRRSSAFAYAPVTAALIEERLFAHLNLGLAYDFVDGQVRGTWGVAGEAVVFGPLTAVGEVYGRTGLQPFSQIGGRATLIPDRMQLEAVVGVELGSPASDGWVSIGLRFFTPPFLGS